MVIQSHFNRTPTPPEKNSGEKLVEVAGYITAQQRIELILSAGRRLNEYRKEQFDFHEGKIDEDFFDPTRTKNYDIADGFQDGLTLKSRIKESSLLREAAINAEKEAAEKALKEAVNTLKE